jgi:SecD/SecF fusion protein
LAAGQVVDRETSSRVLIHALQEDSMSAFTGFLTNLAWLFVFLVLPILMGFGICRALRVKEFAGRTAFVLLTIFIGFLPFALRIVQDEVYAYRTDAKEWVAASAVKDGVDPDTKETGKVDPATGKLVRQIPLTSKDIRPEGDKWVLVQDDKIDVVKKTTFDLSRWPQALSYGIDLAGGTNLVYELDEKQRGTEKIDSELMNRMVGAVTKRINPAGTKEIVVRRVGQMRIEVILPGADPAVVEETKELMTRLGTLEFSIVANERDHGSIIRAGLATKSTDVVIDGKIVAKWRPVAPNHDDKGRETPNREFEGQPENAVRQIAGKPEGYKEILILYEPDENKQITGKLLKLSYPTRDSNGSPAVGFRFNQAGGFRFHDLTSRYKPRQDGSKRQLAVLLNNEVHTAPSINQPIGDSGIIEGGRFDEKEVEKLVSVLNAGALPVPIKKTPISEFTISPTLGYDVQSKGKMALVVSSLAVIIFMAAYYFVAGLVADFALLLNLLFIVSIMAFVRAAFTLPGLAGLVLSAGMAVDANVLIYERMREELARGASLRMAIHNGFDKAFAAIFDSNIATLISSVILYMIGTEQVKGFAVSLIIGLAMNLFTAVYVSRLIMNILERSRTIKQVKMLSLVGVTNFDFVGKQVIASVASSVLIVAGLAAFFVRGNANYDIDFTGGVSVTMQFNEVQKTDDVRDKLEKAFNKNITVEELTPFGAVTKGRHFRLRVANEGVEDIQQSVVEGKINEAFPGMLVKTMFTFDDIEAVAGDTAGKKAEAGDAAPPATASGHETHLTFTNDKGEPAEIATTTFSRYLEDQLKTIRSEGSDASRYAEPASLFSLRGTAGKGMAAAEGKVKTYTAMTLTASPAIDAGDLFAALSAAQKTMQNTPLFDEVTSFESSVAGETKQSAVFAIIAALLAIVAYVWFRFENLVFGLAAVIALAHDVLASLGCVALASYLADTPIGTILMLNDFKINMAMIAAFLTIVGYSLNDTIVIFDRLREIRGKNPVVTKEMINSTVNQCFGRTLLTAFTVFITVLILYALGGEGIHGFAFCMVIGSIVGTYSTVYIASPLVLVFMNRTATTASARRPMTGAGTASAAM